MISSSSVKNDHQKLPDEGVHCDDENIIRRCERLRDGKDKTNRYQDNEKKMIVRVIHSDKRC